RRRGELHSALLLQDGLVANQDRRIPRAGIAGGDEPRRGRRRSAAGKRRHRRRRRHGRRRAGARGLADRVAARRRRGARLGAARIFRRGRGGALSRAVPEAGPSDAGDGGLMDIVFPLLELGLLGMVVVLAIVRRLPDEEQDWLRRILFIAFGIRMAAATVF